MSEQLAMKISGIGQICLWPAGSLWIGLARDPTDIHAHHAVQVCVALEGAFRLCTPTEPWKTYAGVAIPSHQPHAFDGGGALVAHIFVEPESAEGTVLLERYCPKGIGVIPQEKLQGTAEMARLYGEGSTCDRLAPAARGIVRTLTADTPPRRATDPRVLRAIGLLQERLDGPIPLDEIAEAVFLSPSRFRHLFVEETGVAFRRYIQWLRLQRVLEGMTAGESLTQAALAAGFADAAHMSRTFRRMFGVAPSTLRLGD